MAAVTFNTKRSGCYLGESAPLNIINKEIVVLSGSGILDAGRLLAERITGTATVTPGAPVSGSGQTVGNGAVGTWTAPGAVDGTWLLVITNEAANLGAYKVLRPDGSVDGFGAVGTPYNGTIKGTLADGSNDWKEDDQIPIVVSYVTRSTKFVPHDPDATNGDQVVAGILFHPIDATSADVKTVATVRGPATINGQMLSYKTGISAANRHLANEALRAKGLSVLPQHAI